jgi:hypothetical protein
MTEHLIDNHDAALFFTSFDNVQYLQPFILSEHSLSEAARTLNISKTRMSYWLTKMQALNLIRVVRVEKRGKHNVPVYHAVADMFRVPLELLPIESDEAILEANTKNFEQAVKLSLVRTGRKYAEGWHICCHVLEGRVRLDITPGSGELEKLSTILDDCV